MDVIKVVIIERYIPSKYKIDFDIHAKIEEILGRRVYVETSGNHITIKDVTSAEALQLKTILKPLILATEKQDITA